MRSRRYGRGSRVDGFDFLLVAGILCVIIFLGFLLGVFLS